MMKYKNFWNKRIFSETLSLHILVKNKGSKVEVFVEKHALNNNSV